MSVDSIDVMIIHVYTMCSICMVHEGVCSPLTRDQEKTTNTKYTKYTQDNTEILRTS